MTPRRLHGLLLLTTGLLWSREAAHAAPTARAPFLVPVPAEVASLFLESPASSVFVRRSDHHTEDFAVFEQRPAEELLRYRLELQPGMGFRMVEGTRVLEVVDRHGTPRLRMLPPSWWPGDSVDDDRGSGRPVRFDLPDCQYDRSAAPPWGRPSVPPGNRSCTIVLRWHSDRYPVVVDPVWTSTGNMAFARSWHIAGRLPGDRVLVASGGLSQDSMSSSEIWDAATGTFAMAGPLSSPRREARSVVLHDGRVMVTGGTPDQDCLNSTELFDPQTGVWAPTGSMIWPRCKHQLTLLDDGRVLATGGRHGVLSLASAELFDPKMGQWIIASPMAMSRKDHAAATLPDGRAMVAGGVKEDTLSSSELYDPAADSWIAGPPLSVPRRGGILTTLSTGRVLLVGGHHATMQAEEVEWFDVSAPDQWKLAAPMPEPPGYTAATLLSDGRLMVAGGHPATAGATSTAMVFSWSSSGGSWSKAGMMGTPRVDHTLTLLQDGRALASGGYDGKTHLDTAEVFALEANGAPCEGAGECASAWCVDDVCCESSCDGICVACSKKVRGNEVQDGLCRNVAAGIDPKDSCLQESGCGRSGECDGNGSCAWNTAGIRCGETACMMGFLRNRACDGAGECVDLDSPCAGSLKCPDGVAACLSECTRDDDCVGDRVCLGGECVQRLEQGKACGPGQAPCEVSLRCVEGICCDTAGADDCGQYRCSQAGVCNGECASSADCRDGARCDSSKHCVAATVSAPSRGCACGVMPSSGQRWSWIAGLVVVGAFGMRRRFRAAGAALAAAALLSAAPAAAQERSPEERSAMEMFNRGNELRRDGDLEGALEWYQRSIKTVSSVPNLMNAASCLAQLGRHDESLELYELLLARFGDRLPPERRQVFESAIKELREVLAEAVISTNVQGSLLVDGRLRGQVPRSEPLIINSGAHVLRLVAPEYEPAEARIIVQPRERIHVDLQAKPIQRVLSRTVVREVRSRPWGGEVFAGLVLGSSLNSAIEKNCQPGCPDVDGAFGQVAGARLRYDLRPGLGLEATAGYLRMTQSLRRGIQSASEARFHVQDDLSLSGPIAGLGGVWDFPLISRLRGAVRGSFLAWVARSSDIATASVSRGSSSARAIVQGSGESAIGLDLAIMPEVGLTWTAGKWHVGAGLAAGLFFLRGPSLPLGETVPVIDGPCPPGSIEARCSSATAATASHDDAYGMFVVAMPTIHFGTTGW